MCDSNGVTIIEACPYHIDMLLSMLRQCRVSPIIRYLKGKSDLTKVLQTYKYEVTIWKQTLWCSE